METSRSGAGGRLPTRHASAADGTAGPGAAGSDPAFFDRPLFEDPRARNLSRVGVVDIGSNSVRLVVFDGAARSPAYFYNEKVMCALGAGMAETGRLNALGRERALAALQRFQLLAQGMGLPSLTVVATAAVRDAIDGPDFCEEARRVTGLKIWVISGEMEARFSAQGVLLGWPGSYGLVCDIGGSSMELAEIRDGIVKKTTSSPLGPLKLRDIDGDGPERAKVIKDTLDRMSDQFGPQHDRLFLVGGSWRAIARIDMMRRAYPLQVLHEYRMSYDDVMATVDLIAGSDPAELRLQAGISNNRMALVPIAAEVLGRLVKVFKPADIAVSSYGIREGLLYEYMPKKLQDRDPLIEACRFFEAKDARLPGFGRTLYDFVLPLFPDAEPARLRLIRAACLLHDVSWRSHPDYRAEVCFEYATRANLGGLKHWERIYLGLALLHRYRKNREGTPFEALYDLLDEDSRKEAEILGKALRFGAMLWMQPEAQMATLDWDPEARKLHMHMRRDVSALYGEVAESRLTSLANALQADLSVSLYE
ncbi:Ppx/GppA family phosphatase [Chachezhania antarctica]|uniref:Ppx/GppA family phosphatase n=1 Tax=Chachezhania antarctica TaxID=2340860 RepID=UPI000EAB5E62|nr:Ppx/GppA family phosphatase [Chachezhania antarctica]